MAAMKWNPIASTDAISREARRIIECSENLSLTEKEAIAGALSELAWAVSMTQPWPAGNEFSLSAECIDLFRQAAVMAERERREHAYSGGRVFSRLLWRQSGAGEVVPFNQGTPDGS